MPAIENLSIVITGASSGIGADLARALSERGAKLMLGARREDRLAELCEALPGTCAWRVTDVRDADQVKALVEAANNEYGRVDVLINNAGLMPLSFLSAGKIDEWDQMIDVNIKGVLYGIAAALPIMNAQNTGHIINVASIAGHTVFPAGAVYCATKHAVRAITEGMRQESRHGVRSTIISPGPVKTELPNTITDGKVAAGIDQVYQSALEVQAITDATLYAIEQPSNVDVNEILVRPLNG